jgi:hypothetical protein
MEGKQLVKLAADFSAGTVTAAAIKRTYGDGVFATVAALAAGGVAGVLTDAALDKLDKHTGVVSAAGDVVDAGIGVITSIFEGF